MFDLPKREKNSIALAALFIIIFLAFQFIYFPVVDRQSGLKRVIETQKETVKRMKALQQEYQGLVYDFADQKGILNSRPANFTLFSFLDKKAQSCGVKDNVAHMKPFSQDVEGSEYTVSRVKLKLTKTYLEELVDFLYRIESSNNGVYITSLSLTRAGVKKDRLDVVVEAETLVLKGNK